MLTHPSLLVSLCARSLLGSVLYVTGAFTGVWPAQHVAAWDGAAWSAFAAGVGSASTSDYVRASALAHGRLYVGGLFDTPGKNIAAWDGVAWAPLAQGTNDIVTALAAYNGALYAGGVFTSASGVAGTKYLARWDGSAWSAVSGGGGGGLN